MPLYSFYRPIAQVQSGIGIVSLNTAAEQGSKCGAALGDRRKNFIAPGKRCGFPEHGCNGAVLVFTELNGVLYRRVLEVAAQTIAHFQPNPARCRQATTA